MNFKVKRVPVECLAVMWENGGIAILILNLGARWWRIVSFSPAPFNPRGKKTFYQSNMRLGGPQKRSGRFGIENNLLNMPGFERRLLRLPSYKPGQYTDCAVRITS